jgi:hypothetical protein
MIRATGPTLVATLTLAAAVLLAGCAGSTDYPSLARRDVERVEGSASPAAGAADAVPTLPPASADLTTRLASLLETARKAHQGFEGRRPAAERAVAGAGGRMTDSWTDAQVALSGLQTSRSAGLTAVAELDRLYAGAREANPEQVSPSAAAIATVKEQVDGWIASEDAVIARLDARLR